MAGSRNQRSADNRSNVFRYRRRVQFAETDLAGIAHFACFFRYMEEAEHALWLAEDEGKAGFPDYHRLQIQEFLQAVQAGREPAVTGVEARKSLEIILAIYESSRTGRPVSLPMQP